MLVNFSSYLDIKRCLNLCVQAMLFLCYFNTSAQAQTIHVDTLKPVIITDTTQQLSTFKKTFTSTQSLKSFTQASKHALINESVASLLDKQSAVFIKQHGVNSLNTMTVRGASAAQSQLLWEGVPLNAASTGIADLSIIQNGMFDRIEMQYGGNSSIYGSGNMGAALMLSHQAMNYRQTKFKFGIGSYDAYDVFVSHHQPLKDAYINFKGFFQTAKNDFEYKDYRNITQTLTNAERIGRGLILNTGMKKKWFSSLYPFQLQFSTWWQNMNRDIPPATFEQHSSKRQYDQSWRNVLLLQQGVNRNVDIHLTAAYFLEKYEYNDAAAWQAQSYISHQYYAELALKHRLTPWSQQWTHQYLLTIPLRKVMMITHHNNDKKESLGTVGIASVYQVQYKKSLTLQANARYEMVSTIASSPLIVGLSGKYLGKGWEYKNWEFPITFKGGLQRSFRYPTLNELYIFPGGNANLKPEIGWNAEVGMEVTAKHSTQFSLTLHTTFFNRIVDNWIYWMGGSLWTPHNIAKVHTRGWDWQFNLSQSLSNKWRYQLQSDFTYTIATTTVSDLPNNRSLGKQLPYTPRYVWRNNLSLHYDWLSMNIHHQYVGYRFMNLDESAFLQPYRFLDVLIKGNVTFLGIENCQLGLGIYNVLDEGYEIVYGRPMPPRNYQLSLQFVF